MFYSRGLGISGTVTGTEWTHAAPSALAQPASPAQAPLVQKARGRDYAWGGEGLCQTGAGRLLPPPRQASEPVAAGARPVQTAVSWPPSRSPGATRLCGTRLEGASVLWPHPAPAAGR